MVNGYCAYGRILPLILPVTTLITTPTLWGSSINHETLERGVGAFRKTQDILYRGVGDGMKYHVTFFSVERGITTHNKKPRCSGA